MSAFGGMPNGHRKVYSGTQPLMPEDVAEIVYFCHALPPHVNINSLECMPITQASSNLAVYRNPF